MDKRYVRLLWYLYKENFRKVVFKLRPNRLPPEHRGEGNAIYQRLLDHYKKTEKDFKEIVR